MAKKIWIDAGHGGSASGAVGCNGSTADSRMEKDDTLTFALELNKQFLAQGCTTVMTRTTDRYVELNDRTALERAQRCDLAISCHRNGAADPAANGFEVWLHSTAPQSYVQWARDIAEGVRSTGMAIRAGQFGAGVYKGFRGDTKANYYANSGTNSPSCLLELGFMGNAKDNKIFDAKLMELCVAVVNASCEFLGIAYKFPGEITPKPPTACVHCAEFATTIFDLEQDKAVLKRQYDDLRERVDAFVADIAED